MIVDGLCQRFRALCPTGLVNMTHWYTADTHFGDESIIPLWGRPFRHASHMDSVLVERMWEKVGPDDDLWMALLRYLG